SEHAEGAASEVLKATAGMVKARGWQKAVKKGIQGGHPAEYAVVAAVSYTHLTLPPILRV
ncbi:hypothetical protein BT092_11985, partial [Corynebacterium diphtheriae]